MITENIRTGAAVIARIAQRNPLEILARFREEYPNATAELLFLKWAEMIRDDDDLLGAVLRHTFTNLLTAVERSRRSGSTQFGSNRGARAATPTEVRGRAEEVKQRVTRVVLLNLMLPNGKALRYSTFADCASAGGWLANVAKLGQPNDVVGQTVTERQLAKLWDKQE